MEPPSVTLADEAVNVTTVASALSSMTAVAVDIVLSGADQNSYFMRNRLMMNQGNASFSDRTLQSMPYDNDYTTKVKLFRATWPMTLLSGAPRFGICMDQPKQPFGLPLNASKDFDLVATGYQRSCCCFVRRFEIVRLQCTTKCAQRQNRTNVVFHCVLPSGNREGSTVQEASMESRDFLTVTSVR